MVIKDNCFIDFKGWLRWSYKIDQWFSNVTVHQNYQEVLLKHRFLSHFTKLGWGLICISNRFLGDTDSADLWRTFGIDKYADMFCKLSFCAIRGTKGTF